jgi:arylsulfatase
VDKKPNIVLNVADNLASEGLLLQNFNVESDCVPTRSALMSGRHPIRTGCLQSVPPGLPQGLARDEITLAQQLSGQGYATAHYGKWHLGDIPGRYPSDRGFDEWYGIPRTTDESQFTSSIGFDPSVADIPHIMQGQAGSPSENVKVYDLETRRGIDAELVDRSIGFMRKHAEASRPFFLYLPLVHLHFPTLPHPDFAGRTGAGDFADSMVEMDHRVGQIVQAVDELKLRDDTVFIFCSVPFMIRWPGKVQPGQVSNEIVHVTDLYTTLSRIGGASMPQDRPIDGIDQTDFFTGASPTSLREGFLFYIKNDLRAVKWRDWKLHFYWEPEVNEGKGKLESPYLFNLKQDPKEESDILIFNTWVLGPILKMVQSFNQSCAAHPNTPPGKPDPS